MRRGVLGSTATAALLWLAVAAPAPAAAAGATQLLLSQGAAFSILGHSCGGIQEQAYATGFAAGGHPVGDVYMQTRCGGSGRGGGYKTTTYSAWASVEWDWFGDTRSFARLEGAAEVSGTFSAEDSHGDRVYNTGTSAWLQTGEPPLQAPAPPAGVTATLSTFENAEEQVVRQFQVQWTAAAETAAMITSSTVTATPVGSSAPVLSTTVQGTGTGAIVGPLETNTTYVVTVTSTDVEGTSEPSGAIEASSGGPATQAAETCEQNSGTIKLTPGLEETPHVQSITVKGVLSGCDGGGAAEGGRYTAHLVSTEELTCSALQSASAEPTTSSVSFVVKWLPKEVGTSKGALTMPISEAAFGGMQATLSGGPFEGPATLSSTWIYESFTGASSCGVQSKTGKVKPVKSATFATSPVEISG